MNHKSAYLRTILGFIGIVEVELIHAENLSGVDEVRQSSLVQAHGLIAAAASAVN